MRIIKLKTSYKVESQTKPGTFYFVNLDKETCTCPEWAFRMKKIGGICKHINAVQEKYGHTGHLAKEPTVIYKKDQEQAKKDVKKKAKEDATKKKKNEAFEAIIEYVKVRGDVDSVELIDKFGEAEIDDLIRLGELIEENGRIKILE